MKADMTILTYTDNSLDTGLESLCQDYLMWSAGDLPIVSVSQEPMNVGTNICVGNIGHSISSMFRQLLTAAKAAKTKYVAIAEHDCLYPKGYFNYIPQKNDTFFYNKNYVVLYLTGKRAGLFTEYETNGLLLSQLFCNRNLLIDELTPLVERLKKEDLAQKKGLICELGAWTNLFPENDMKGKNNYKQIYSDCPTVDIKHEKNLTVGERGPGLVFLSVPYWGTVNEIYSRFLIENEENNGYN